MDRSTSNKTYSLCSRRSVTRCLQTRPISSYSSTSTSNFSSIITRDSMYCFARLSYHRGVRPSVCLTVCHTLLPYENGASHAESRNLQCDCNKQFSFCDKISCRWLREFFSNKGDKRQLALVLLKVAILPPLACLA